MKNYVFIDSNNLFHAIKSQGWTLDFLRFRKYLQDKYHAEKVFIFIGYIKERENLYASLRHSGYTLIFKKILRMRDGKIKGNCDAELVLHTMIEYPDYDAAIIVSNDGDFTCLLDYLVEKKKLAKLLIPDARHYSALFRPFVPFMHYMNDLKNKLEYKKSS